MKTANKAQRGSIDEHQALKERVAELEALVDEHERIEKELQDSEQLYRLLAENTVDAIFLTDMDLNLVYVNASSINILGYAPDEIIGSQVESLFSPVEYAKVLEILAEELAKDPPHEGRVFEAALLHKDGHEVDTEIIGRLTFDAEGNPTGIQGSVRDITERKQSQQALLVSENRYRQAVENSPNPIFAVDSKGRIQAWNRACESIYQYGREIIGRPYDNLLADPGGARIIGAAVDKVFEGGSLSHMEIRFRCRDGSFRITTSRLYPLHGSDNRVELCIFANTDMTERKRVEQEKARLEEQLHQAQKMEAIGRLAGGVAHDMNNVLGAIMGSASALDMEMGAQEPCAGDIQNIVNACRKGRSLIQDLLGFAHKGKFVKEDLSLNDAITRIDKLLRHTISKKITIKTDLEDELYTVQGDPSQIENALMNICINASDAMNGQGRLTIATENVLLEGPGGEIAGGLAPGGYARIQISDTGAGMDLQTQARAIEPFFTTKPRGKGTGLGLSMVYGVIKNHGGTLSIDSAVGVGTTVTILLPRIERSSEAGPQKSRPRAGSSTQAPRSGGVLLVDDEETVLKATSRLLETIGYTVFLANNGQEAIATYRTNRDRIDLVLLDLIMPLLDGPEAFKELKKKIDPDVRVLLSSGYSKDEKVDRLLKSGAVGFLKKPFDAEELSDAIKQALIVQ